MCRGSGPNGQQRNKREKAMYRKLMPVRMSAANLMRRLMPGSKNLMRRKLHCVIDEKNLMPVRMSAANLMRNLMHGLMHKDRN